MHSHTALPSDHALTDRWLTQVTALINDQEQLDQIGQQTCRSADWVRGHPLLRGSSLSPPAIALEGLFLRGAIFSAPPTAFAVD